MSILLIYPVHLLFDLSLLSFVPLFSFSSCPLLSLHILTKDLSSYLSSQPPLSAANLYRKQYGNLLHAFSSSPDLTPIFTIQNDVIALNSPSALLEALRKNLLSEQSYQLSLELWEKKRVFDLQIYRMNGRNICKRCGIEYAEIVNCTGNECVNEKGEKSIHQNKYDWSREEEDVDRCEIK